MGIERIHTPYLRVRPEEHGPVEREVHETYDERIRFVGKNWLEQNRSSIPYGMSTNGDNWDDPDHFIEVVFYGTGLHMLCDMLSSTLDIDVEIDGGAATTITGGNRGNGVITGGGISNNRSNGILPLVSGLTQGVHTAVIRGVGSSVEALYVFGFEILNNSTSVTVPPGSITAGSGKVDVAATTDDLIADSTKGGHVVRYANSDGTIGKAINYTDSVSTGIGTVDHTNEQIVRRHHWTEFGISRGLGGHEDFTILTGAGDRTFTLQDGTTSLNGRDIFPAGQGQLAQNASGASHTKVTFIGTGIDLIIESDTTPTDSYDFRINGTSVGSIADNTPGLDKEQTFPVVSGLPFGTHTLDIRRTSSGAGGLGLKEVVIYAPKAPELASDQVALDSYYKMADFVAQTTAAEDYISTGVMRKSVYSEFNYQGNWSSPSRNTVESGTGAEISMTVVGGYWEYTFFGTGFDYRTQCQIGRSNDQTITLDGTTLTAANFPTATFNTAGLITFNSGTGQVDIDPGSTSTWQILSVADLPLGMYTVRFTNNDGLFNVLHAIDIHTPTYAYNNKVDNRWKLDRFTGEPTIGSNSLKSEILPPGTTAKELVATNDLIVKGKSMAPQTGTYRPVFYVSGSPTSTVVMQAGPAGRTLSYLKIGPLVHVAGRISILGTSSQSAGNLFLPVMRLPFKPNGTIYGTATAFKADDANPIESAAVDPGDTIEPGDGARFLVRSSYTAGSVASTPLDVMFNLTYVTDEL
jgi:hypothetical protein